MPLCDREHHFIVVVLGSYFPLLFFFFSSRRRHTRCSRDWSSDVCSSDLPDYRVFVIDNGSARDESLPLQAEFGDSIELRRDRKSTRLNSSHGYISYAVFCLKKKKLRRSLRGLQHEGVRTVHVR